MFSENVRFYGLVQFYDFFLDTAISIFIFLGEECYDIRTEPGSYDTEVGWTITLEGSSTPSCQIGDTNCCFASGTYAIACTDSYGDGWNGYKLLWMKYKNVILLILESCLPMSSSRHWKYRRPLPVTMIYFKTKSFGQCKIVFELQF